MQKNGIGTLRHYKNMTLLNYTSNEMEKNKNWSLFPNTQSITTQEHERLEQLRYISYFHSLIHSLLLIIIY